MFSDACQLSRGSGALAAALRRVAGEEAGRAVEVAGDDLAVLGPALDPGDDGAARAVGGASKPSSGVDGAELRPRQVRSGVRACGPRSSARARTGAPRRRRRARRRAGRRCSRRSPARRRAVAARGALGTNSRPPAPNRSRSVTAAIGWPVCAPLVIAIATPRPLMSIRGRPDGSPPKSSTATGAVEAPSRAGGGRGSACRRRRTSGERRPRRSSSRPRRRSSGRSDAPATRPSKSAGVRSCGALDSASPNILRA